MTAKRLNPPPKKGPCTETDLEALYHRRLVVQNLIRSMEAYVRADRDQLARSKRVA
jgi:hypothetical protein